MVKTLLHPNMEITNLAFSSLIWKDQMLKCKIQLFQMGREANPIISSSKKPNLIYT